MSENNGDWRWTASNSWTAPFQSRLPAVVIENGLLQMLQRLRSNQDYQQWWLKMDCFKCFKDSVPIKTTNGGDWKWTASNASKTPLQSRRPQTVVIENELLQTLQRLRCNQDYQQWWLNMDCFKCFKDSVPIKTTVLSTRTIFQDDLSKKICSGD